MGLLATIAIGVVSVLVAGLLVGGFLGFIVAVIVGVILVAVFSHVRARQTTPKWRRTLHVD
jgi:predicted PurR-regulated permease PerM